MNLIKTGTFRMAVAALVFTAGVIPTMAVTTSPAGASPSPTYSATGLCMNGAPEAELSVTGVASQTTLQFSIFIYAGKSSPSSIQASGGVTNVLWNLSAFGFLPGPVGVAVAAPSLASSQNPKRRSSPTNLPLKIDLISFQFYEVRLPICNPGPTQPITASVSTPDGKGYWRATPDGQVRGLGTPHGRAK